MYNKQSRKRFLPLAYSTISIAYITMNMIKGAKRSPLLYSMSAYIYIILTVENWKIYIYTWYIYTIHPSFPTYNKQSVIKWMWNRDQCK